MFAKILIANRGEIACRIIDTCRRMGVATVAVYSDADANARHVAMADEAIHIGPPAPGDSYLRGDTIIRAAQDSGAQAIHPGYGFLSENPDFVDAVEAAGLTFIGPSTSAIRAMGLKDAAKTLMTEAGVPVVPGYHGDNQEPEHLSGAADQIGYPVLIKAVAGGGGKGMRRVDDPADFRAALNSAKGEARTAFGNDAVLIEKYVTKPRHIEVQVFGDGTDAVHLFERDCSAQRRHQKVIEEAPAPGMTPAMRAAMGQAAVTAAKAIGYAGAGTIEFIVDASHGLRTDAFWFMEMNTRLQVEHPVSEAITGVDLVQWQLRVASGEALPMAQDDLTITGHAFEARLYAEDAANDFLPATGRLAHLAFPNGARIETGVRPGDAISPWYDPMIAKLVVHGPNRDAALTALTRALEQTQVAGTQTNLDFLGALSRNADFRAAELDTAIIERNLDDLIATTPADSLVRAIAAFAGAGLDHADDSFQGFSLWAPLRQTVVLRWGELDEQITLEPLGPGHARVTVETATHDIRHDAAGWWADGAKLGVKTARIPHGVTVFAGRGYHFDLPDPLDRGGQDAAASDVITAPMPGLVKAIMVTPGQVVTDGQPLAVLEAMKMEHNLTAGRDGTVAEVLASPATQVEEGAALIRLETEEEVGPTP